MERKESRIFRRFLTAAYPGLGEHSFSLLNPPEPDVLLKVRGKEETYFELAEIIDFDFAQRINLLGKTAKLLKDKFAKEPIELHNTYKNAIIWIRFQETASIRERTKIYPKIVECMKLLPPGYVGKKHFENLPLTEVEISRGEFVGPIIEVSPEANSLDDPIFDILGKKLGKTYSSRSKPNLLLYYEVQPSNFSPHMLGKGEKFWQQNFDRLWIYDDYNQKAYKF